MLIYAPDLGTEPRQVKTTKYAKYV